MQSLNYWVNTFLSQPDEVVALALTLIVFAIAAVKYPDSKDKLAVVFGFGLLVVILSVTKPAIPGEWHYWVSGSVLASIAILAVDDQSN